VATWQSGTLVKGQNVKGNEKCRRENSGAGGITFFEEKRVLKAFEKRSKKKGESEKTVRGKLFLKLLKKRKKENAKRKRET